MIINNFKGFVGQHCETTATGALLKQIGIDLSEPMLFGIGEGLGFIYWKMKTMDFPFMGGRVKTDSLTENICKNLNLNLKVSETTSVKKAWKNVAQHIDNGKAVGIKLDCYHLEYFTSKIHFAGHYAALYGYDKDFAYLVDTDQQGGKVKTKLKNFELARNERGPMSSRNLSFFIDGSVNDFDLKKAIPKAILNNAKTYLNPPIKNLTYKGIQKASKEIKKWFEKSENRKSEFQTSAMLMERAGTGGSLFRNLYRDFLFESAVLLNSSELEKTAEEFKEIALLWKSVSDLFHEAGETEQENCIHKASDILVEISGKEKREMERLNLICMAL